MNELSLKVEALFGESENVLEGEVWIEGRRIEVEGERTTKVVTQFLRPLLFDPPIITAQNVDSGSLQLLLEYLKTYNPITERGVLFFPSAAFSLKKGEGRLSLYIGEDKSWAPGEAIDVFNQAYLDINHLESVISILGERRVSSFVWGKLVERKDYSTYTLLRRYYLE